MSQHKKTTKVFFPCVHGSAKGKLIQITCFSADELKGPIKVVSGVDDDTARRIIGASRYGESDDRAASGVISHFSNPLFTGESYGLALAIADKIVRQGEISSGSQIYATGSIPADGCGAVDSVKDLLKKIQLVKKYAPKSSIFILPKNNLKGLFLEVWQELDQLEECGIEWRAIDNVNDLEGVLWSEKRRKSINSIDTTYKLPSHENREKPIILNRFFQSKLSYGIILGILFVTCAIWLFSSFPGINVEDSLNNNEKVELNGEVDGDKMNKYIPEKSETTESKSRENSRVLESGSVDLLKY